MQPYQDVWIKGNLHEAGQRDCTARYAAIKSNLSGDGFSVLDMGAYSGYFSFRLAEDFNAKCLAIDDYIHLPKLVRANANPNVKALNKRLSLGQFQDLGRFDVILCLSFLHHVDNWRGHLEYILENSACAFIEIPHPSEILPNARNKDILMDIYKAVHDIPGEDIAQVSGYDNTQDRVLRKVQ